MPFPIEIPLFVILILSAVMIARATNLFAAAMLTGLFSLTAASLFTMMDAVDVAFTEAAVGAGFSTVLFLGTLALTSRVERQQPARIFPFIVVLITGTAMAVGMMNMKHFGDIDAPIHQHVSKKIKDREWPTVKASKQPHPPAEKSSKSAQAKKDEKKSVGLPNLVTSVLGSYRGYDTLGDTGVIFADDP